MKPLRQHIGLGPLGLPQRKAVNQSKAVNQWFAGQHVGFGPLGLPQRKASTNGSPVCLNTYRGGPGRPPMKALAKF